MSDIAREIAIRHCPGETELPLSAHSRAVWIDSLTDAIRAALASTKEQCARVADAAAATIPYKGNHEHRMATGIASAIRSLQITGGGK